MLSTASGGFKGTAQNDKGLDVAYAALYTTRTRRFFLLHMRPIATTTERSAIYVFLFVHVHATSSHFLNVWRRRRRMSRVRQHIARRGETCHLRATLVACTSGASAAGCRKNRSIPELNQRRRRHSHPAADAAVAHHVAVTFDFRAWKNRRAIFLIPRHRCILEIDFSFNATRRATTNEPSGIFARLNCATRRCCRLLRTARTI